MLNDPIVQETREIRDALAARFNYDVRALGRYLQEEERKSGRIYKSYPPKPVQTSAGTKSS